MAIKNMSLLVTVSMVATSVVLSGVVIADAQDGACIYTGGSGGGGWSDPTSSYAGSGGCASARAQSHIPTGWRVKWRADFNVATPNGEQPSWTFNWTSYDSNNNIVSYSQTSGYCGGGGLWALCGGYQSTDPSTSAAKVCARTKMYLDSTLYKDSGQDCTP